MEISMRHLVMITLDTIRANAAVREGSLAGTISAILEEQRPEVVYFTEIGGARTAVMVIDLQTLADLPGISEPWFLAFDARVELHPAMVPADLQQAGGDLAAAAAKYG
jgi:hypothetical protein